MIQVDTLPTLITTVTVVSLIAMLLIILVMVLSTQSSSSPAMSLLGAISGGILFFLLCLMVHFVSQYSSPTQSPVGKPINWAADTYSRVWLTDSHNTIIKGGSER